MSMRNITQKKLGEPDILFSGLEIWISGRQFPESTDYWDANWLTVTAHCASKGSQVWVKGPILHLSEIQHWLSRLKQLYKTIEGETELPCMEPELNVNVSLNKLGHGSLVVSIIPDHLSEHHEFTFEVDQSFLPAVIKNLEDVLNRYPIKGDEEKT